MTTRQRAKVKALDVNGAGLVGMSIQAMLLFGGNPDSIFWWRLPKVVGVSVPLSDLDGEELAESRPWYPSGLGPQTDTPWKWRTWNDVVRYADIGGRKHDGWRYQAEGELSGRRCICTVFEADPEIPVRDGSNELTSLTMSWDADHLVITASNPYSPWFGGPLAFQAAVPPPFAEESWKRWMELTRRGV